MKHHSKTEQIAATAREFAEIQKYLRGEGITFIMPERGASMFVPRWRQSIKLKRNLQLWQASFMDAPELVTPAQAARKTLAAYHAPYSSQVKYFLNAPIAWRPTQKHVTYIDIKSAYYQVYKRLTLSSRPENHHKIDYRNAEPLMDTANELKDWKLARNSIPGLLHGSTSLIIKQGEIIRIKPKQKYQNQGIWFLCNAVMHEIATIAQRCGMHYAHTDGFFIDRPRELADFLDGHGIAYTRAEGILSLTAWQSYKFLFEDERGDTQKKQTKNYKAPQNSTRMLFGLNETNYNQACKIHSKPFIKIKNQYHYIKSIFGER